MNERPPTRQLRERRTSHPHRPRTGSRFGHPHVVVAIAAVSMAAVTMLGCTSSDTSPVAARPTATATSSTAATSTPSTAPVVPRPTTNRDELVEVGGGRLHLRCSGAGPTTVLLLAGFEGDADVWSAVTPGLTAGDRVCAYDRFGTGTSSNPTVAQTFATQAEVLHALLAAADEPGPYVVVGHSFGGAEAVTFASAFPDEVAGLLLLDASPATWPATACAVPDDGSETAASFRTTCAMFEPEGNVERLDVHAAFDLVARIDSLGDLPMIVAPAAERSYPGLAEAEATRLRAAWDAGQSRWTSLSSAAQLVPVADTGHVIQVDQPAKVTELIRSLLP